MCCIFIFIFFINIQPSGSFCKAAFFSAKKRRLSENVYMEENNIMKEKVILAYSGALTPLPLFRG